MKTLLIWGASDQGTVTLDCSLAMNIYSKIDLLDFKEKEHREIPGCTVYSEWDIILTQLLKCYDEIIVATGDNIIRVGIHIAWNWTEIRVFGLGNPSNHHWFSTEIIKIQFGMEGKAEQV